MRFGERLFRNEATVISPTGEFLGVCGKDHPVLFGGKTSPTRDTYPVYPTPLGRLGLVGAAGLCPGRPAQPA
jgi:apolipoprotein N-acyltransferase